jgi:hypothetical protein
VFERFTGRARRVLVLAYEEARLLQHNFVGTEHLLLGLMHEGEGTAAKALESLGISLQAVRVKVAETTGPAASVTSGSPPFTPRAKKVLELSLREALQLGHNYIGTEHLLLGLVREGEGVAAQVLVNLGADLARVRQRVGELVRGGQGDEPGQGPEMSIQPSDPAEAALRELEMRRLVERRGHREPGQRPDISLFRPMGSVGPVVQSARMAFRGPGFGGPLNRQVCALCGRDLWEVDRYISAGTIMVCDRCITDGRQVIEEAEVTGDGPELHLPPRVFGEVPDNEAVQAIVKAFERGFNVTDLADRGLYLEDAEGLRPYDEQVTARFPNVASTFRVERIRFLSPDRARVYFWITVTSPSMTFPVDGAAVRVDGRWKVSRATQVDLLTRAGVQVPEGSD